MACGFCLSVAILASTWSVAWCTAGAAECQGRSCQKTVAPSLGSSLLQKKQSLVSAPLEDNIDEDADDDYISMDDYEDYIDIDASELDNAEMVDKANTSVVAAEISRTTASCAIKVFRAELVSAVAEAHSSSSFTATLWGIPDNEGSSYPGQPYSSVRKVGIEPRSNQWDATWIFRDYTPKRWKRVTLAAEGSDSVLLDDLRLYCGRPWRHGYRLSLLKSWGGRNNVGWCLSSDLWGGFDPSYQTAKQQDDTFGPNHGDYGCATTLSFWEFNGRVTCRSPELSFC